MESFTSYAKTRLSHRELLGSCQQFYHHHRRDNRKEPGDQKDDPRRRGLPISLRHHGTILLPSLETLHQKSFLVLKISVYLYVAELVSDRKASLPDKNHVHRFLERLLVFHVWTAGQGTG